MSYTLSHEPTGLEVIPDVTIPLISWELTWDYNTIAGVTDKLFCTDFRPGTSGTAHNHGMSPLETFLHVVEIGFVHLSDFTRLVGQLAKVEGQTDFRRMAAGFVPSDLDDAMGVTFTWQRPPPTPEQSVDIVNQLGVAVASSGSPAPQVDGSRPIPKAVAAAYCLRNGEVQHVLNDVSKGSTVVYSYRDYHALQVFDWTTGGENPPYSGPHYSVLDADVDYRISGGIGRRNSVPAFRHPPGDAASGRFQDLTAVAGHICSRSQPAHWGISHNLAEFATVEGCPWALPQLSAADGVDANLQHDQLIKSTLA